MLQRTARCVVLTLCAPLVLGCLVACSDEESRLDRLVTSAPANGRTPTTNELVAAFDSKSITFEGALVRAEMLLEQSDPNATLFAGAVLDMADRIEPSLPSSPEFELFWRRLGQLAYSAAFEAMQAQRWDEAATLVLAGPRRWQREPYWLAYPNHDILVAVSMGQQGDPKGGIARLRSRPILTPEMDAAIEQLRELDRQQLRERLRERIESENATGG